MWRRGGSRAPHKPLLILYALSLCVQNKDRLTAYPIIENHLKKLLVEFGPSRKSYHPEYPFWRLQNDKIWELSNSENVTARKGNTDAKKSELLKYNVHGGFTREIHQLLRDNPEVISEISLAILEDNFPHSMHDDILQAVGLLELDHMKNTDRKRDPDFRDKILNAYEHQCAVCGFNVRVGNSLVALEAAHIKWYQAGGPDDEENGIALCSLHHKLFDRGAFTISQDKKIQVSDKAYGTTGFTEWLMAFHGECLKEPQRPAFSPKHEFISWHIREVFQGEGRYMSIQI